MVPEKTRGEFSSLREMKVTATPGGERFYGRAVCRVHDAWYHLRSAEDVLDAGGRNG